MLRKPDLAIIQNNYVEYPQHSPYYPDKGYPELLSFQKQHLDPSNHVYSLVRESLCRLGMDLAHENNPNWNPFVEIIFPGNTVIIKPNAVWDINLKVNESVFASITHGSILRVLIDYTYIALKGQGKIIIADAPIAHSDFQNWKKIMGLAEIIDLYRKNVNFEIKILDLRKNVAPWDFQRGISPVRKREEINGDLEGYLEIDLGAHSEFKDFSEKEIKLLYGSDYNRDLTIRHHINNHHKYLVSKTVLNADSIISVPKMKVHKKVGVTLNIKGLVGTQGDKNYIPHHKIGSPLRDGDEYPDLGFIQNNLNIYRMWLMSNFLAKKTEVREKIYEFLIIFHKYSQLLVDKYHYYKLGTKYKGNVIGGSWYGNDTAWRMAIDLSHIILNADKDGKICEKPQRNFFCVIDGIIGGEKEGPLAPQEKKCGVIISGYNPLFTDCACSRLMGFDISKIPMLVNGLKKYWLNPESIDVNKIFIVSNISKYQQMFNNKEDRFLNFVAPVWWEGHIEI